MSDDKNKPAAFDIFVALIQASEIALQKVLTVSLHARKNTAYPIDTAKLLKRIREAAHENGTVRTKAILMAEVSPKQIVDEIYGCYRAVIRTYVEALDLILNAIEDQETPHQADQPSHPLDPVLEHHIRTFIRTGTEPSKEELAAASTNPRLERLAADLVRNPEEVLSSLRPLHSPEE